MFTGIITDIGEILSAERDAEGGLRITVGCDAATAEAEIGASIANAGVCLTVVAHGTGPAPGRGWYAVDVSEETTSKTAAKTWETGGRLNLERALKVGDELGGHIVTGHVDGVAEVVSVTPHEGSLIVRFRAPAPLARFIAPKGSVALDGVSLTVNEVEGREFTINFIPHTQAMTTFSDPAPGREVNLEIDTLARYVARLAETEDLG